MKLMRTEWVRNVNEYILDVNEEYCAELTSELNKRLVGLELTDEITPEKVCNIMTGRETDLHVAVTMKSWNGVDTYEDYIDAVIECWVDEDLWSDEIMELCDSECDDYETTIIND